MKRYLYPFELGHYAKYASLVGTASCACGAEWDRFYTEGGQVVYRPRNPEAIELCPLAEKAEKK